MHILVAIIFFSFFAVAFISIVIWSISFYGLIYLLKKRQPTYFKKIGSPMIGYLGAFGLKQNRISNSFSGKLIKGIPKGFPNDAKCRRLAKLHRDVTTVIVVAIIITAATGIIGTLTGNL